MKNIKLELQDISYQEFMGAYPKIASPEEIWDYLVPQLNGWVEYVKQSSDGIAYYRGVLEQIGLLLGDEVYVCDDGTISDSVLIAKLVDIIKNKLLSGGL